MKEVNKRRHIDNGNGPPVGRAKRQRVESQPRIPVYGTDLASEFVEDGVFANAVKHSPDDQRTWHNLQLLVQGASKHSDHILVVGSISATNRSQQVQLDASDSVWIRVPLSHTMASELCNQQRMFVARFCHVTKVNGY